MATMVLSGFRRLDKKLKKMVAKDAKKAIRQATRPALKPVLQESKQTVPVKSGQLKKSLKIRALPRSRRFFGSRVTSGAGKNQKLGNAFYGAFIELGTKRIKAREFMKNAANKKKKQVFRLYKEELKQVIRKIANG